MFAFPEKSLEVIHCQSFSQSSRRSNNLDSLVLGGRQKHLDPYQR